MQAYYDNKPTKMEAVGNGSYIYRFNIREELPKEKVDNQEKETTTAWRCDEVTVWPPITSNRITEKVITEQCDNNQEQKLVNEFNAANMGMYGPVEGKEAQEKINAYKDYLTTRSELKEQVDKDCKELGIV